MKQNFYRELKGHYNLRCPKGNKPTTIFFVVGYNGKQYKFNTGVKIYPCHWNKRNNTAIISNQLTKQDNKNNEIVNKKIKEINLLFSNFKLYLCNNEDIDIIQQIKTIMKKRELSTIKMIEFAFDYYYRVIHSQTKDSSIQQELNKLNSFIVYIQKNRLEKNVSIFTQSGINAYKEYLIKEKQSNSNINQLCGTIVKLINNVLCVNDDFLQYNFRQVKFVKLQDKRLSEEKGSFPLTEQEIKQIEDFQDLTDTEKRYKILFLFQCETGWRISEIKKVIEGDFEEDDNTISVITKKTGEKAYSIKTEKLCYYLELIKNFQKGITKDDNNWHKVYNTTLKRIAKKIGLNREITIKTAKGETKVIKIYQKISSHWARHTKVTLEYKKGTPKEIIIKMTGHNDTKMIEKVYTKLTDCEKKEEFTNYFKEKNNSLMGSKEMTLPTWEIECDLPYWGIKPKKRKDK